MSLADRVNAEGKDRVVASLQVRLNRLQSRKKLMEDLIYNAKLRILEFDEQIERLREDLWLVTGGK